MGVSRIVVDRFKWKDKIGTWVNVCRLEMGRRGSCAAVLLSDLDEHDTGRSITNDIELLATFVCEEFGLSPRSTIWIEHYPERGPKNHRYAESFDLVQMDIVDDRMSHHRGLLFKKPRWIRIDKVAAYALLDAVGFAQPIYT